MKPKDLSMTPYSFHRLPFEEQLKCATMELLNDPDFYANNMGKRQQLLIAADPRWAVLEAKLLSIGGTSIAYVSEPHLDLLSERGKKFAGKSILDKGLPSACHENVAELWTDKGYDGFRIVTGWALSKDDMWRQHSFGQWNDDQVIETTMKRSRYFGVVLLDGEAFQFASQNSSYFRSEFMRLMQTKLKNKPDKAKKAYLEAAYLASEKSNKAS